MLLQKSLVRRGLCVSNTVIILIAVTLYPVSECRAENDQPEKQSKTENSTPRKKQIETLQDLIREVERNEALYTKQKLNITSVYEEFPKAPDPNLQIRKQRIYSLTLQGPNFRLEEKSKGRSRVGYFGGLPKKTQNLPSSRYSESESLQVFDGSTHRSLSKHISNEQEKTEQKQIQDRGQISDEYPSLTNFARPHMYLLSNGCPKVPLSTYLKGMQAVLSHPNPSYVAPGSTIKVQLLEDSEFKGLKCKRILVDTILSNGTRHNGWELWLALDRNLLPVRNFSYTYRWSKEIPIAESIVDQWREVHPGIWFPIKIHTDRYNSFIVKREGKQTLSWRRQEHVTSVELDPQNLAEPTFTQLDFPKGISIYIEKDGQRTNRKTGDEGH